MNELSEWATANPYLAGVILTTVVWPLLSGVLSFTDEWLAARAPTLAALLRGLGFDAKSVLRIIGALIRIRLPFLPVPPEVIESARNKADVQ